MFLGPYLVEYVWNICEDESLMYLYWSEPGTAEQNIHARLYKGSG